MEIIYAYEQDIIKYGTQSNGYNEWKWMRNKETRMHEICTMAVRRNIGGATTIKHTITENLDLVSIYLTCP
jgi:urate oxidase